MNAASHTAPSPESALRDKLRDVQVGLREDLEVTRHLFRGTPSYVIRDPVTFHTQRLDPADYDILVRIDPDRSLAEIFADLVQSGKAIAQDEEKFYQFMLQLHRLGFLHLPVADDKALYRRFQTKVQARRREWLLGFLFLRVPLYNPDAFLQRTIRFIRPLFSRTAMVLWFALMLTAGFILLRRWHDLIEPLQGMLAARNLALMWVTLVVLKVFHEFGHAFACKHYGGHVPEMGAYFILFTPCAYVDASASWGFTGKRERIVVCLAGMYVESIIAALAVFLWAATGPSLLNSAAHNVIFLAGTVTVLFNINPLMRYDGYYILSDLVEVPNLRARAAQYLLACARRCFLGIPSPFAHLRPRMHALLLTFGVAAGAYRITVLLAICAILASRMFLVGLALGALFLGITLTKAARRLIHYLWHAEETTAVRGRAIALGIIVLFLLPAGALLLPLPSSVHARGLLQQSGDTVVHAAESGFLTDVLVEHGARVRPGDPLAILDGDTQYERVAAANAALAAAELRRDAFRQVEPHRALQEGDRAMALAGALRDGQERLANLTVRAPSAGTVIDGVRPKDAGKFLGEGSPIAVLASGNWQVRALLSEDDMARARPRPGDVVRFRPANAPGQTISARIVSVAPAGSRTILHSPLTQLGGGAIPVDPNTEEAREPYFELIGELEGTDNACLRHGITGTLRLHGVEEPIGRRAVRRIMRFVHRLMRE